MLETKTVTNGRRSNHLQCACHDTLDFIQVPGYPSAIRVFALTHSRRNVVQRLSWLISVSLDRMISRLLWVVSSMCIRAAAHELPHGNSHRRGAWCFGWRGHFF